MNIREWVPLAPLTTMGVGGPARVVIEVDSTSELIKALQVVGDSSQPLLVLGGGSNVIISDDGFDGTVIRVMSRGIALDSVDACSGATVVVAAGEPWDDVVAHAVRKGWSGLEALSGIPGCAGSTPIQNVGAYGQDVSQTIARVRVWDREQRSILTLSNRECDFSYRHSRFKDDDRFVVLDVTFQLGLDSLSAPINYPDLARQLGVEMGDRVPLAAARAGVIAQRKLRGMVLDPEDPDTASCGSFFTNPLLTEDEFARLRRRVAARLGTHIEPPRFAEPDGWVKTSAAWLIDRAGYGKGYGLPGPAALSTKHTLAITNRGGALAADIAELARTIQDGVEAAFGVLLVHEPVFVGDF